jgi:D-alanyl-D-alanine dipeptidase
MNHSNRSSFKPLLIVLLLVAVSVCAQKQMDTISSGNVVKVAIIYSREEGSDQAINPCKMRLHNDNPQKAVLSSDAADLLKKAADIDILRVGRGGPYGLLVYDAYRTASVQDKLKYCTGDGTAQNIEKGNAAFKDEARATEAHTKGNAVDVTLIRIDGGANSPQDMGTAVNSLTQCSFALFEGMCYRNKKLDDNQLNNRQRLRNAMFKAGWCQPEDTGWWHFELCQ